MVFASAVVSGQLLRENQYHSPGNISLAHQPVYLKLLTLFSDLATHSSVTFYARNSY